MKYFIIAGEPSGDQHGADLIRAISNLDTEAEFRGMGGDAMIAEGLKADAHIRSYAIMGFIEVLMNIFKIHRLMTELLKCVEEFNPDRIILIDYGGFNLRFAKRMKKRNREVDFYILPKVWAWNEGRVKKIARYVDRAYVIFPFEESYFQSRGVNAIYAGNPVVSQCRAVELALGNAEVNARQIVLLPGSRKQEIKRILPVMLEIPAYFKNFEFVLALREKSDLVPNELPDNVQVVYGDTHHIIRTSQVAIAASGTVNLETALWGTPQIVVYKANPISFTIGKLVVRIAYISPVNLILDRGLVQERIQSACNPITLKRDLEFILSASEQARIKAGYDELRNVLTNRDASVYIAKQLVEAR